MLEYYTKLSINRNNLPTSSGRVALTKRSQDNPTDGKLLEEPTKKKTKILVARVPPDFSGFVEKIDFSNLDF